MLGRITTYQTAHSSPVESFAVWQEYLRAVFYDHGVQACTDAPIEGLLKKREVADIGVVHHQASAHSIFRDRGMIERDKVEKHAFVFPLEGRFHCTQRSREHVFVPGQMYVLNTSEPFRVSTSNASSFALILPSYLARLIKKDIDDDCIQTWSGDPLLISALQGLLDGILRYDSQVQPTWLRKICTSLLDATLNPLYSSKPIGILRASDANRLLIVDACMRCIRERLHERNFGVNDAAAACGVSVRHLQAVLKSTGSTFGRELLVTRLERAADLLRSGSRVRRRIGEIAIECGFSSQAHFATRYREYFGVSPSEEAPAKTGEAHL